MTQPIAAIVGVAESDLGVTNKSIFELQVQAIKGSLADSGLLISDVDALLTNGVSSRFSASLIGEYLGIAPSYIDTTFAGGASYEVFVARAAEAVRAGLCEVALVSYGSNQRSARSRRLGGVIEDHTPDAQFEAPYGPLSPMSLYAMAAQRHMHEFGTTPEQLAEVAVAAREWALLNPKAFMYGKGSLTIAEVLESEMVSSPLHKLDCCLITDGGGAVVITSVERARDLDKRPVYVLGHGEASTNTSMSQVPDLTSTGGKDASARAYKMAGIGPGDIDVTQIYDSFTITVLLTLEALGFCERGEAGSFVEGGRIAPGGGFALNTSGGGLSYCHPGMYGIFLIIEAVRQLRGECGARQISGATTAVSHGTGGLLGNHATVVLGAE